MNTAASALFLFIPRYHQDLHTDTVKLLPIHVAINYIIQYNPCIVIVEGAMQPRVLDEIQQSVRPWFSGHIIKRTPRVNNE